MRRQRPRTRAPRSPWLAVVICLVGSPASSMLYLGRGRRALAYLGAVLASYAIVFGLARSGLWPAGLSWLLPSFLLTFAGAFDTWRVAWPLRKRFAGPWYATWKGLAGIAIAFALLSLGLRAFVYEPFRVPAASMLPTLVDGDYFFVNKFAYGLRLPFTSVELTNGEAPKRGDVIVFRVDSEGVNYVKRIVGVPGDVVAVDSVDDRLTINGEPVLVQRLGGLPGMPDFELARESIGGREHELLLATGLRSVGGVYRVPPGHYFVLGDNRDNSRDSRYQGIGFVPEESIIGRASLVWWNPQSPERAGKAL